MSGSDNAADIAERRKLEKILAEQRESLNDTYYSHAKDSQQQALEDEATAYEESMNKFVEGLRTSLESALLDMDLFIQSVTSAVISNAPAIVEQYDGLGVALDGAIIDPWKEAANAIESFGDADGLGIMNSWLNEGGIFPTFKDNATDALTSPWAEGGKAIDTFKTSITTKMGEVVSNIRTNVTNVTNELGKISSAYAAINDTTIKSPSVVNNGGNDGNGSNGGNQYNPDVAALQEILNGVFNGKLKVDGIWGPATEAVLKNAQTSMKNADSPWIRANGKYDNLTRQGIIDWINEQIENWRLQGSGSSMYGQAIQQYNKYKNKLPAAFHAKGTLGTKRDEWAITDEPQFGDELTMYATPEGTLSFMRAGSTVIPANLTKEIINLPGIVDGLVNRPNFDSGINMISNAVNKPEFKLDIENFLRCDNVSQDTLPELKKFVNEKMNFLMKQLNYSLKKSGAR